MLLPLLSPGRMLKYVHSIQFSFRVHCFPGFRYSILARRRELRRFDVSLDESRELAATCLKAEWLGLNRGTGLLLSIRLSHVKGIVTLH